MEEPVHLQIPAVVLVGGLGAPAVKVCRMHALVQDLSLYCGSVFQTLCFLELCFLPEIKLTIVLMASWITLDSTFRLRIKHIIQTSMPQVKSESFSVGLLPWICPLLACRYPKQNDFTASSKTKVQMYVWLERRGSKHKSTITVLVFFYWLQPYALRSARMEVPVQLQIPAPALVGGLGALAVKVCDSMHDQK